MNIEIDSADELSRRYLASRELVRAVELTCRNAGVEPRQYELLLTVSEWHDAKPPTVRNIASRLGIRHNSTVELIDRAAAIGALTRVRDGADRRQVFIEITPEGRDILHRVADAIVHGRAAKFERGANGIGLVDASPALREDAMGAVTGA